MALGNGIRTSPSGPSVIGVHFQESKTKGKDIKKYIAYVLLSFAKALVLNIEINEAILCFLISIDPLVAIFT